jgi:hypothetical protein
MEKLDVNLDDKSLLEGAYILGNVENKEEKKIKAKKISRKYKHSENFKKIVLELESIYGEKDEMNLIFDSNRTSETTLDCRLEIYCESVIHDWLFEFVNAESTFYICRSCIDDAVVVEEDVSNIVK